MSKTRAYSVSNVLTKKFHPLEFSGDWEKCFGKPDKAFSAAFYGDTSNGKTESAIQFAKYLTNFGKVDYNSLEQGLSSTMKNALIRNNMENSKNTFRLLDRMPFDELIERFTKAKSADFLFIDSAQYLRITKTQYYQLKELMVYKRKGIIWILQAKGNKPKGALADDILFDVDIKAKAEGFKLFPDGRLNGGGEPLTIWPQKAAKYWNEII